MSSEQQSLSLDQTDSTTVYKIITSDSIVFLLDASEIKLSTLLTETFNSKDNTEEDNEIVLETIHSSIFKYVYDYLKHFSGDLQPKEIEKPLKSGNMKECTDEWSANFIDNIADNRDTLYKLITASNFLNIQSLLHLACAKIAGLVKGIPIDKIKETLLQNSVQVSA